MQKQYDEAVYKQAGISPAQVRAEMPTSKMANKQGRFSTFKGFPRMTPVNGIKKDENQQNFMSFIQKSETQPHGTTPNITITTANASTAGALSAADWTNFNSMKSAKAV